MEQRNNKGQYLPGSGSFKPGESGNPHGRPKTSVTTLLKNASDEDKKTIAKQLTGKAKKGDLKAIDMFIDRTDGKVIQQTDHTFNGLGLPEILAKLRGYPSDELGTSGQLKEGEE